MIVNEIANKNVAYLREGIAVNGLILEYPYISMSASSEKYFPVLIGLMINKNSTTARTRIYKMYININLTQS